MNRTWRLVMLMLGLALAAFAAVLARYWALAWLLAILACWAFAALERNRG